ncbi:hypothetical protein J31TS6_61200 [Brevibacillus reuszeri]|uniref:hypothetical protein n=1 Tax=Brevibacillus reuszeri TaxID=54915 RepID=UPI001B2669AD|nr:hypothetical protein [Brevibacillus reuszeri]GIO10092.1 hypothetical protein J31TS6_61200 [Brevibacillus reuszeri]
MRRFLAFFVLCLLAFLNASVLEAFAKTDTPDHERRPLEDSYFEIGYKSLDLALKECEKHFGRELPLPFVLPPVAFTHHFGRCHHSNDVNDHFEIEYINEKQAINHYMIQVKPLANKLEDFPRKNDIIQIYKLKDGTKAVFGTTPSPRSFYLLVFERAGWQYILSIDKRIEDKASANVLIDIAESVNLTPNSRKLLHTH